MVRSKQDTASGRISFTQGPVDGSDLVLDDDHDDGDDNDDNYENDAHGNGYSIERELEGAVHILRIYKFGVPGQ